MCRSVMAGMLTTASKACSRHPCTMGLGISAAAADHALVLCGSSQWWAIEQTHDRHSEESVIISPHIS